MIRRTLAADLRRAAAALSPPPECPVCAERERNLDAAMAIVAEHSEQSQAIVRAIRQYQDASPTQRDRMAGRESVIPMTRFGRRLKALR